MNKNGTELAERKMKELRTMKEKRIRLFKLDQKSEIKNVFFFENRPSQIHVILYETTQAVKQYSLFGDGFRNEIYSEDKGIIIPEDLKNYVGDTVSLILLLLLLVVRCICLVVFMLKTIMMKSL